MKTGIELITEERQRQIEKEGWTEEHDDEHVDGDLAQAAAAYATNLITLWPWEYESWRPSVDDRRKNLIKAGALIAAEIDRVNRALAKKEA